MDPVMQVVFGNIPIDKLISKNSSQIETDNSATIYFAIGTIVVLGITICVLYEKNKKLQKLFEDTK